MWLPILQYLYKNHVTFVSLFLTWPGYEGTTTKKPVEASALFYIQVAYVQFLTKSIPTSYTANAVMRPTQQTG